MKLTKKQKKQLLSLLVLLVLLAVSTFLMPGQEPEPEASPALAPDQVPDFSGQPWAALGDSIPDFTDDEKARTASFEEYSPLDSLGRCGVTMACIGTDLMPTEDRGSISSVRPTGWVQAQYDFVDGKSLWNRCHLIGFQLTGENANERNLITGTRYLNVEGMLPFENMVADYVKETGGHVLYRVTPVFQDDELVARGVVMEGWSVEDGGEGICFHVYCYNVQPGVVIDYATGESRLDGNAFTEGEVRDYVLNISSKKFHLPECSGAMSMSEKNRQDYTGTRELLIAQGFAPCPQCNP